MVGVSEDHGRRGTPVDLPDADRAEATTAQPLDGPYERATSLIIHLSVLVVGLDLDLRGGVSATLPLAVVLLPLWARVLRSFALATAIMSLAGLAVVNGLMLSQVSSIDHTVVRQQQVDSVVLLFTGMGTVALLLWARDSLSIHRVVALYGAGALLHSLSAGNLSWKYGLAVPVTLLVLGLFGRDRRAMSAALILGLGLLGVLDEGRSYFGICVLAATLTLWQMWPRSQGRRRGRWRPALLMLGLAVAVYSMASALLTGGYLGDSIQARSVTQIETSGSLITGGRPEWTATMAIMRLQPTGYGLGVVPNWHDITTGQQGLDTTNIETGNYAKNYMFGGQFKLHSITADLWVTYGWAGLALALTIIFALIRSLSFAIADRTAATSVIFVSLLAIWFMLFGPIYSNWLDVCAAVGLALTARSATLRPAGLHLDRPVG